MTPKEQQLIDQATEAFKADFTATFIRLKSLHLHGSASDRFNSYKRVIADYFGMSESEAFKVYCRTDTTVLSKGLLIWLCQNGDTAIPWGLAKISEELQYKHHSSVMYSNRVISSDIEHIRATRNHLSTILRLLGYELVKEGMSYTSVRV